LFFTNNLFSDLLAAADAKSTPERSSSSNFIESMTQPNLTSPSLEKPLKAVNNDIMNLFDKVYILKKNAMIKYGSGYCGGQKIPFTDHVTKKLLRIRAVCVQREAIMADDFSNTFV
jgi:hypothetical protein